MQKSFSEILFSHPKFCPDFFFGKEKKEEKLIIGKVDLPCGQCFVFTLAAFDA